MAFRDGNVLGGGTATAKISRDGGMVLGWSRLKYQLSEELLSHFALILTKVLILMNLVILSLFIDTQLWIGKEISSKLLDGSP